MTAVAASLVECSVFSSGWTQVGAVAAVAAPLEEMKMEDGTAVCGKRESLVLYRFGKTVKPVFGKSCLSGH